MRRSVLVGCLGFVVWAAACGGDDAPSNVGVEDAGAGDAATHADGSSTVDAAVEDATVDAFDAPSCAPPTSACGASCVNLTNDKLHCGTCANACLDGIGAAGCASSTCTCQATSQTYCAGTGCTTLDTNEHCGRCGNACGTGASCVGGKCRFSPAGTCTPWGLAYGSGAIYWTEFCAGATAIRKCATATSCSTLPTAIYSGTFGSLACGVAIASANGTEYVFNTDNQGPSNNRLWRSLTDGSSRTDWSQDSAGGPASLVTNGTNLWWGSSSAVYRSAVGTAGMKAVLDANPSVLTGPGSLPQGIAVDAVNVYAGRSNFAGKADGVVACPIGADCTAAGEVQVLERSNVNSLVTDGTSVFASTLDGTTDGIWKCPIAGCSSTATAFWSGTTVNSLVAIALAVDSANIYFNTRDGKLYACDKTQATCASPKLLHTNVHAGMLLVQAGYLYWTNTGPNAVYRTKL